ncbi:uncharacterized protein LOC114933070 isoform X1 [Nylanderia fulva]|uniref:uncharacterized protein LOC114933070 isoform X1 n=1 Tax=Nylanderia fulva TaxID=613905 RepID=UPI0010FAEE08|nr:uncharacterized protein LOC114933070 isoform X1 [Nylanderia fulva]
MKRIYLIIVLTFCTCNVLMDARTKSCFHFTWPGRGIKEGELDCKLFNQNYTNIPCVDPIYPGECYNLIFIFNFINSLYFLCITFFSGDQMPDTTEISNWTNSTDYFCKLELGSVCVKYLYIYNKAVINASYFCGKVIEDQAIAVTSGCYVTYTEGYTIEACVCEDTGNGKPCNSTIRNTYSILIIFITIVPLFIYKIFNIS